MSHSHKWEGRELPQGKTDETFRMPGELEFVQVGTLEWTRLEGKAFGPVAEAARDVFMDAPGAVSRLDIDVSMEPDTVYASPGFRDAPKFIPRHSDTKVSMDQPRLYVYRVMRDGKALGLVFLNRGVKELGGIGE